MGGSDKFDGFDFLSGTRGAERLGDGLQWPELEAAVSSVGHSPSGGYHTASAHNMRHVYGFR
jgi:hypothetical protein